MIKHLLNHLAKAACITAVFMLLFNCHGFHGKNRISENELVAFMADLHMANAIIAKQRTIDLTYKLDSASLYGSLFDKYGFTKAQFDTTMVYYSKNPEKLKNLMNLVTARLQEMEQAALAEEERQKKADMEIIWRDSTERKPKSGKMDKMDVDIPIRQVGMYTISVTVRLFPDDHSVNPRMTLYFSRDDTTADNKKIFFNEIYYTSRSGESATYTTSYMLTDSSYTRIRGSLANFNNEDSLFKRNLVISDLTVFRMKNRLKGNTTGQ